MFDDVYANIDFSVSYDSTEYLCLDSHGDNPALTPESRKLIIKLKNYINNTMCAMVLIVCAVHQKHFT